MVSSSCQVLWIFILLVQYATLGICEMQTTLSRIWTLVAVSISYDSNYYTMNISLVDSIIVSYHFFHPCSLAELDDIPGQVSCSSFSLFLSSLTLPYANITELKLYRKSTNKNDHIQFYLHHNNRIKSKNINRWLFKSP